MTAPAPSPLPIDAILPSLLQALRRHPAAVLTAPTGAGKTTRVPPALVASGLAGDGRVVMLEPRRLAARAAARRMAAEQGWRLGVEVGWQVRFDRRFAPETRIVVVTEGILVQWLQADPFLEGTSVVVFDELHERNLATDLALAMARQVQRQARGDLKLLAMSATLAAAEVAAFLGDCPVLASEGRLHPVEIRYARAASARRGEDDRRDLRPGAVARRAAAGVREMLGATDGDVLVFLPGVGEIRRTGELLEDLSGELDILPLYGDLPAERQDAVLSPGGRRKVVLATNVAESSVTIPGVSAVVDTGLVRRLQVDPGTGLDRLALGRVSRASADQRAGRAGRERPGVALRLWGEHEHPALPEREVPEIRRVDLAATALQLLAWGETDLAAFGWLDAPEPEALGRARELLRRLGALGSAGITPLGRTLAMLPVHPRLGRLLVEGQRRGAVRDAALAAALLAERDPFPRPGPEDPPPPPSPSDLLDRLEALERLERGGRPPRRLHPGAARFVLQARDQLLRLAERELGTLPAARTAGGPEHREALGRALLAAFPDRLCRRRAPRDPRAVMVGGRGVRLAASSAVTEVELFLALDLDAGVPGLHAEALVRRASAVERAWLPAASLTTEEDAFFEEERERVVARRRLRWEDLVLEEAEVPAAPETAARLLAEAAASRLERALPLEDEALAAFLARLRWLAAERPELGLPDLGEAAIRRLLPSLAAGRRSLAELRRAPWLDALRGGLSFEQLRTLDREAPERLEVPSGSRIRLTYEPGKPPVLAVRIQELFGLAETPRLAGGRVPVLLHLLAPNFRPQQVTRDLASFWRTTYAQVRKELAGRYPKHDWPEDPTTATPRRRPGRKRS